MKNILFYHEALPGGGVERVTIDIAEYLSLFEYDVYVVTRKVDCDKIYDCIKILELPGGLSPVATTSLNFLIHTINSLRIDVFVLPVQLRPSLCQIIKNSTKCKIVFSLHSIPCWELLYSLYDEKLKIENSFRKMLKWHLVTYPKAVWFGRHKRELVSLHKAMYSYVDAYTVLCEDYKLEMLKILNLSYEEAWKLHVIPNSERQVANGLNKRQKQLLFVGRMTYQDKRVDRLINIWKLIFEKVPDWELVLVGDGEDLIRFQQQSEYLQLQRIRFVGWSDRTRDYYQNATILCLTSTFEGWPLCLTEAQANGVIPVAFDCSAGVHEILAPSGVNGFLVPPFDLRRYARVLLEIMNDEEKQKQMRDSVRLKARDYAPEVIGKKWLHLFETLIEIKESVSLSQSGELGSPVVSVIIPVYNDSGNIKRCIDSVLSQTFINFEILLVDDGSTDTSKEICEGYAELDGRVKIFHKKQGGSTSANQLGILQASGDYIIFVNSSDWIEPDMLGKLQEEAARVDVDIVVCDYFVENETLEYRRQEPRRLTSDGVISDVFQDYIHDGIWNKLIRHELYKKHQVRFLNEVGTCGEKYTLINLLMHANGVGYIPKAFYHSTNTGKILLTKGFFYSYKNYYVLLRKIFLGTALEAIVRENYMKTRIKAYFSRLFTSEEVEALFPIIRKDIFKTSIKFRLKLLLLFSSMDLAKLASSLERKRDFR